MKSTILIWIIYMLLLLLVVMVNICPPLKKVLDKLYSNR